VIRQIPGLTGFDADHYDLCCAADSRKNDESQHDAVKYDCTKLSVPLSAADIPVMREKVRTESKRD